MQQVQDNVEVVIGYWGRNFSAAEKNYSTSEREALAVVQGIKAFRPYLYGRHFTVHTDHHALKWLMSIKDPEGRLARWALSLQQYSFDIQHRSGKSHGNADGLSRRSYDNPLASLNFIDAPGPRFDDVKNLQRQDPELRDTITYLENNVLPENARVSRAVLSSIHDFFLDEHGLLCRIYIPSGRRVKVPRKTVVVPQALKGEILTLMHDDVFGSHLGTLKTYEKIRQRYYWQGMSQDVQHWCKSCVHCAMKKNPPARSKGPLLPLSVGDAPFDRVACDAIGPLTKTRNGNRYIIVFSDYLTRWVESFATPTIDSVQVAKLFVNNIIARFGAPRVLLTDRGSNFISGLVREICHIVNTEKVFTSAYHPQTDGLVERFNGTLIQCLSFYCSSKQDDWDEQISSVCFAYNTSPSEVTGESPFYLLYGRDARLPIDASLLPPTTLTGSYADYREQVVRNVTEAQAIARDNIQRAQQNMKLRHDENVTFTEFQAGEKVWIYTPKPRKGLSKKLRFHWHGPFRILKRLSENHYLVKTLDNKKVPNTVHVSRMKRYIDPNSRPIDVPVEVDDFDTCLREEDLPVDSFVPQDVSNNIEPEMPETLSSPPENVQPPVVQLSDSDEDEEDIFEDPQVFKAEKILDHRKRKGKTEYFVKWFDYSEEHNTWEPEENILDPLLITSYHEARKEQQTAIAAPSTNTFSLPVIKRAPSVRTRSAYSFLHNLLYLTFILYIFMGVQTGTVAVKLHNYDSTHGRVAYYPESLMISKHPKLLVLHHDTTLLNIQADLTLPQVGSRPSMRNRCAPKVSNFYNHILQMTFTNLRTIKRLSSFHGVTNIIECDSYLRRAFQAQTGLPSTMICPRVYLPGLKDCKNWARDNCKGKSHAENNWLRSRSRRSSWACHAGGFGLIRMLYESTGHTCESNHIEGLKTALSDMSKALAQERSLIHTVNGKVVLLMKSTEQIHSRVNGLISSMNLLDKQFKKWKIEIEKKAKADECNFKTQLEFSSKFSTLMTRIMSSLLRLIELNDLTHQINAISSQDLVGFNQLPPFLTEIISTKLSVISELSFTAKALDDGIPLMIKPMLDYEFLNKTLKLSLFVTIPKLHEDSSLCTIEYLSALKYKVDGKCYSGPMTNQHVALLSCPTQQYLLSTNALSNCWSKDSTLVCDVSILQSAIQDTSWVGLPWTTQSKIPFKRSHKPSKNCPDNPPFYHLGGRYYLSTSTKSISVSQNGTSKSIDLSPLMVFQLPCDMTFPFQETGIGPCPSSMSIHVPIFGSNAFSYVPWEGVADDSVLDLHYESLNIPPPLELNSSVLHSLDATYDSIDGRLGETLQNVQSDINNIKEAYSTTLNDTLTYLALSLAFLCLLIQIIGSCIYYRLRQPYSLTPIVQQPVIRKEIQLETTPVDTSSQAEPENIELQDLTNCDTCHKPQRLSHPLSA